MITKILHVQSVLPYEITLALKAKTKESSNKEAISKAIYHFLKCQDSDGRATA
ncbi:MAG: DUF5371 family protein [Candidatus Methanoperedens sp.]|nr:DUF5371 family protein [Candidatus Methanoperedens sp.]